MKDKIQSFINHPYTQLVVFLCAINAVVGFMFSKLKNIILIRLNIVDNVFVFYLLTSFVIFVIILLSIIAMLIKNPRLYLGNVQSSKRIADYERLDDLAKKEIYIMGIGLNNISKKTQSLNKMLDRDIHILLLLFEPAIADFTIKLEKKELSLNEYFTKCYMKQLSESYDVINQLYNFIKSRKAKRKRAVIDNKTFKGKIELRKYNSFIPMNITATDIKDSNNNMVVEFCIPYSQRERIRFSVKKYHSKQIHEIANHAKLVLMELFKESELIISDY